MVINYHHAYRDFIDFVMNRYLAQPPRDAYFIASIDYRECYLTFLSSTHQDKETILIPKGFRHYLRGLVCCWSKSGQVVLYNHTTRLSLYLLKKKTINMETSFIGYDPLEKQYKVLFLPRYNPEQPCRVFTLGDTNTKWKSIQGVESHHPLQGGAVCINRKIYYQAGIADQYDSTSLYKLMSFDVRSEEFCNVDAPKTLMDYRSYLINYQGKLRFGCCEKGVEIWVMETQGWSNIYFCKVEISNRLCSIGVSSGGEIVLAKCASSNILSVLCCDPKKQKSVRLRFVDLESIYPKGRHTDCIIWIVPDYVLVKNFPIELYGSSLFIWLTNLTEVKD